MTKNRISSSSSSSSWFLMMMMFTIFCFDCYCSARSIDGTENPSSLRLRNDDSRQQQQHLYRHQHRQWKNQIQLLATTTTTNKNTLLLSLPSSLFPSPCHDYQNCLAICRGGNNPATIATARSGNNGRVKKNSTTNTTKDTQEKKNRSWTILLVAIALFNDTLQLTMILPIIHTLLTNPPPLGVILPAATSAGTDTFIIENTEIALGIFFASKDICQMICAPLAAILTTKTSPNFALLLSTIGLGIATLVFAEGTTFRQLLLARACQGAASAAIMCGGMSLIAQQTTTTTTTSSDNATTTTTNNNRGSAMGIAQMGLALGLLCGPIIGGILFQNFGRKRTFQYAGIFVLINAVAQLFVMARTTTTTVSSSSSSTTASSQPLPSSRPRTKSSTTTTRIAMATNKQQKNHNKQNQKLLKKSSSSLSSWLSFVVEYQDILVIAVSTLAIHAVVGVMKPLSQVVLDQDFGITMIGRSMIISIATLFYFVTTPIAGYYSDRLQKSRLVAISLVIMFFSSFFFNISVFLISSGNGSNNNGSALLAMYIGVGLLGSSMGIAGPASQALLADIVDKRKIRKRNADTVSDGTDRNTNTATSTATGTAVDYSAVFALSDVADSLGLILGSVIGLYLSQKFGSVVGPAVMGFLCLSLVPFVLRI